MISRRQLIRRTFFAGTGIAACTFSTQITTTLSAADEGPLPIVDTHQHLWDYDRFRPPWLGNAPKILAQRYATAEYLAATRGLNVVKAVYMEVDVDPRQQVEEARYVIELSKSDEHPTVGAVISGRPNSESFAEYIGQFKDSPYIKGVRQVLHVDSTPTGFCLQPQFGKSMDLLGGMGKSFDICIRPGELSDALKLVRRHPNTQFILDHCGNADPKAFLPASQQSAEPSHSKDQWIRDIGELATCDNLVCKISGIVARAPMVGDRSNSRPSSITAWTNSVQIELCLAVTGRSACWVRPTGNGSKRCGRLSPAGHATHKRNCGTTTL